MSNPYTGGCACGALRYNISSAPIAQNHCQCRDCQRRSGTGHGSYLAFAEGVDGAVSGKAATWRVAADNGNVKAHAFCPTCGAPVYLTFDAMPGIIAVHAGSLDEPERFAPAMVTFTSRAMAWDTVDPELKAFDRMPA